MSETPNSASQDALSYDDFQAAMAAPRPPEAGGQRAPLRSAPQPSFVQRSAQQAQDYVPPVLSNPVARPGTMLPKQCGEAEEQVLAEVSRLMSGEAEEPKRARPRAGPLTVTVLGVGGFAYFAPQLALGLGLLLGWLALGAYYALNHPRFGPRVIRRWHRFARRRPASADRLRRMADQTAMHWEALIDILPEAWAQELSLPDFSQPIEPRADKTPG